MAGIIKVNQYQDFNGNTLFTSDGNGNLTTMKTNYPAFLIRPTSAQSFANDTYTKVAFDTAVIDTDSGFDVVDLGSGVVKVQMNSTFKTWKSAGEQDLIATGLDVVEFIAGPGIDISLDPNGSPYQSITITNTGSADSSTGGGGATALNDLTDVTYDPNTTFIGDRLTWDGNQWVPDADGSSSQFGGSLLGVIIDMDINSDGDLILHHVDTFSNRNAFITDEGYMIFTDGEYWESGYVLDDYVQTDF